MTTTLSTIPADVSSVTEVPWELVERFVGQLTHDVRNGLNALELQLTYLGEVSTDPEAVEEVKRIRETLASVTRQLHTVRNATCAVTINTLNYPAKDFFEDLQERFERTDAATNGRVQWNIAVGEAMLSIDPELSMSAFLELIANALHFGDPASILTLAVTMTEDKATVALLEPRPGPPALTTEGWACRPLQSTRRGAYGLGLFRVRRIIEAQGGEFGAAYSATENTLTTTATLPVSRSP